MSTELRKKLKKHWQQNQDLDTLLHPLTMVSNPSSLLPTNMTELIANGDVSMIRKNSGVNSTIPNKVSYDLEYAKKAYAAFAVPFGDSQQLVEKLNEYASQDSKKDSREIEKDSIANFLEVIRQSNMNALTLSTSLVRSVSIQGVITLEVLAVYFKIKFSVITTNLELAQLILDAM